MMIKDRFLMPAAVFVLPPPEITINKTSGIIARWSPVEIKAVQDRQRS